MQLLNQILELILKLMVNLIRLPIPKLSEERRKEIIKIASEFAENSKVTIRNIRRDFIETSKNEKKNSNLSEDELKRKLMKFKK